MNFSQADDFDFSDLKISEGGLLGQVLEDLRRELSPDKVTDIWPERFYNKDRGIYFEYWNEDLENFIHSHEPSFVLLKGGEGSSKTCTGVIKTLNNLRLGLRGAMLAPHLPNFKRALWPEFRAWCPRNALIEKHRYVLEPGWEPRQPFKLTFLSKYGTPTDLYCGGISDPISWEGPNLNFVHLDEARQIDNEEVIRVIQGRLRLEGPNKEAPQCYITTTPVKSWLYDYFGNIDPDDVEYNILGDYDPDQDKHRDFKKYAACIRLSTRVNKANPDDYYDKRAAGLEEADIRERLEGFWVSQEGSKSFLPEMALWDRCRQDQLPTVSNRRRCVIGLDVGLKRDYTGVVLTCRDPKDKERVVVLRSKVWTPQEYNDREVSLEDVENYIRSLCEDYNVICMAYDEHQASYLAKRLERIVWCYPFGQQKPRRLADQELYNMILDKKIIHNGDPDLRSHISNADREETKDGKLRIVKRNKNLKIDLVVALSMSAYQCMHLVTY